MELCYKIKIYKNFCCSQHKYNLILKTTIHSYFLNSTTDYRNKYLPIYSYLYYRNKSSRL